MEIKLTTEESEKHFHSAICNGADYIQAHGVELDYEAIDYKQAKKNLQEKLGKGEVPHEMYVFPGNSPAICIEDVLMQILRDGNKLKLIDHEGEGEYTRTITLADVHERVQKTPVRHLMDAINENDDATTADVIIQTVFLNEVIFG